MPAGVPLPVTTLSGKELIDMSRFHRTAAALVGVALTASLLGVAARAADSTHYLPNGTIVVLTFNVKQLLNAPLIKGDEKAFNQGMGEASKVLEGFGVNPAKDIDRITLAVGEEMQPKSVIILLEGKFDPAKINDKLKELVKEKKNLESITEGGTTIYQGKLPKQAAPTPGMPSQFYLTVLDDRVIAFATDKDALKEAAGKRTGGKKAEVKKDVLDLIAKISPKETVSIVAVPPQDLINASPAAGLTTITGGITVGEGIKTDLLLSTKNTEAAKNIAQMINEGLNQVKQILPLIAGQQPGFGPKEQAMVKELMDSIKAAPQENGVTIRSNISKEFIEKNSKKDK